MDAVAVPGRFHHRVPALVLALGLCLSVLAPAASAQAATISVTTTDDELNTDGDCSLREAVESANTNTVVDTCPAGGASSDTIAVPAGTYGLTLGAGDVFNPPPVSSSRATSSLSAPAWALPSSTAIT